MWKKIWFTDTLIFDLKEIEVEHMWYGNWWLCLLYEKSNRCIKYTWQKIEVTKGLKHCDNILITFYI